jgi:hypothetical protein
MPIVIVHCTVALELPATALPGLFAANWMVAGVAVRLLVVANGEGSEPSKGMTGLGRRGFTLAF